MSHGSVDHGPLWGSHYVPWELQLKVGRAGLSPARAAPGSVTTQAHVRLWGLRGGEVLPIEMWVHLGV